MLPVIVQDEHIAGSIRRNGIRGDSGQDGELLITCHRNLYHAVVSRVRDEDVAISIHRQASRTIDADSDGPQVVIFGLIHLIAVGLREKDIALLIRGDSQWRREVANQHAKASAGRNLVHLPSAEIRNINVAISVHRNLRRIIEFAAKRRLRSGGRNLHEAAETRGGVNVTGSICRYTVGIEDGVR